MVRYADEVKDNARKLREEGYTVTAIAESIGVSPSTVGTWTKDVTSEGDSADDKEIQAQVRHDIQMEAEKAKGSRYRKLYVAALKDATTQEALVGTMREVLLPFPLVTPSPPRVTKLKSISSGRHTVVAHVSDPHVGEVVDKEVMGGISEYSVEIFRQRLGLWIEKVQYLVDLRRSRLEIDTLLMLLDGDMVSGIIHDELERTNEVNIMEQVAIVAHLFAYAISQLGFQYEEVIVSCTVGNHGRTKQKKEFKERYVSWDYVCYQMMAQLLSFYPNITFDIPKSWFAITKAENTNILHLHGDGIKGWAGFPWYGVDRFTKRMRETLQKHSTAEGESLAFDTVALAHFHVPVMWETPTGSIMVNGNWKGGDEFAFGALHTNVRPIQTLFYINDKYGEVGYEKIYLDLNKPEHAENLPRELADVWAETEI